MKVNRVEKTIKVWSGDTITWFSKVPMLQIETKEEKMYQLSLEQVELLIQDMADKVESLKMEIKTLKESYETLSKS